MLAVGGISKKGVRDLLEGSLSSQRNRHIGIIHYSIDKINRNYKKIFFFIHDSFEILILPEIARVTL
jgi:hypothetical protein